MAIPKQLFQTYKTDRLSWVTRLNIWKIRRQNRDYAYHFYDDAAVEAFFENEMPPEYAATYRRLTIGAAKADFFRYAILYVKGGVYLDLDSSIRRPLDRFIRPDDVAVITREGNPGLYVQWGLIFDKGHPILKRTLEMVLDNINTHRYPHDVHATTGPGVYTQAINACIAENPDLSYRMFGTDFEGNMVFKFWLGKMLKYEKKKNHWRKKQAEQDIIAK
jgi:mannosyltransferase OCH1-like enzyme